MSYSPLTKTYPNCFDQFVLGSNSRLNQNMSLGPGNCFSEDLPNLEPFLKVFLPSSILVLACLIKLSKCIHLIRKLPLR